MLDIVHLERLALELDDIEAAEWTRKGYTHQRDTVKVHERRDFFAIDIGTSGAFMVRKADGAVFGIKGYGTPDYRKGIGFIHELDGATVHAHRWKRGPFRTDMQKVAA